MATPAENLQRISDHLRAHAPSSEAGINRADAKQIMALTEVGSFDNVIQDRAWLTDTPPLGVSITPKGIRTIPNPESARAIFRVPNPSFLVVSSYKDLEDKISAVEYLLSLITFSEISFLVFDTRASDLYNEGIPLSGKMPRHPYRVMRSSRTVAGLPLSMSYTAWLLSISGKHPRSDARQADFRYLNLMEAGMDPAVLSFASPAIRTDSCALHCGESWRENALIAFKPYLPEDPTVIPGFVPRETSQMFPIIPANELVSAWDLSSKAPHFSLIPTRWWRGDALNAPNADVYEMWVDKVKRRDNQGYAFEKLMSTISGEYHPTALFSQAICVTPAGNNKWRIALDQLHMSRLLDHLAALKDFGLRFKNEESGEYLDVDNPKNLDPSSTAFVAGVPPFWLHQDLISALGIAANAKVEKTTFALGDIRTATFRVKAPGISSLHGSLMKSAHESLVILSPDAFVRAKSAATTAAAARRFARGGGSPSYASATRPAGPGGQFSASFFPTGPIDALGQVALTPAGGTTSGGPPRTPGETDAADPQSTSGNMDSSDDGPSADSDTAVDELLD